MNPYNNSILSDTEFLHRTYVLMKKKVYILQEIETYKVRGKLSLPSLREKFSITSDLLSVLTHLISLIDFTSKNGPELGNIYNDLGIMLGKANLGEPEYYQVFIDTLDSFIE